MVAQGSAVAGNTSNLKPWVPGQSGNPGGKVKNLLTRDRIKSVLSKFSELDQLELTQIVDDQNSKVLDAMVASIMRKIIKDGDAVKLDFLFNRIIGKVKEEIDIKGDEEREQLSRLPLRELIVVAQKLLPEINNESE